MFSPPPMRATPLISFYFPNGFNGVFYSLDSWVVILAQRYFDALDLK